MLVAVHAQPVCVVTVTVPLAAASVTLAVAGLMEYVHDAAPACEPLKTCPATVALKVRALVPVLAATVYVTVPGPVRPVPFWNVRKLLPLTAVHAQPAGVVTVTVPLEPVLGAVMFGGLIEYVHVTGVPGTVN